MWEWKWMVHLTYSTNKLACHHAKLLIAAEPGCSRRKEKKEEYIVVSDLHIPSFLFGSSFLPFTTF
jgi:hypothetical protein